MTARRAERIRLLLCLERMEVVADLNRYFIEAMTQIGQYMIGVA